MKKILSLFLSVIIIAGSFSVLSFATERNLPRIIETVYPTDDTVIADIVLTEEPYFADNTGVKDCSDILQRAVNDCSNNGGGTVFLPVGKYRITKSVNILPFVTVHGDWQDPDKGNNYGTVIVADVKSEDKMTPALFNVGGSAGAVGLTVWYPDQSLNDVKPYPYTFYVDGMGANYMLQTIKNCTLINSYRGIGACSESAMKGISIAHEMLNIENVKGTCLFEGLNSFNSADVDTAKTFYISPKYWSKAGKDYNAPDLNNLKTYTKENTVGFLLGDLEWPEYADIKIENCKYGIKFEKGPRISFAGTFYDLSVKDCQYGFYAEKGTIQDNRDKQWGIGIFNGVIEGSKIAYYDKGKNVSMLTNVEINGKIIGRNIHRAKAGVNKLIDYKRTHVKPENKLYVVDADKTGLTDVSANVQKKLDEASKTGGIVYLRGGVYRFDNPVTVPAGVELRGASSVPNRCESGNSNGTLILSYYGYLDENVHAKPLITLGGDNSGISGIRINFVKNNPKDDSGVYKKTSSAVYASGEGNYAQNCFVILASKGFEFEGCKKGLIKKNVGCCYENMFCITDSRDIYIEGNLQNANSLPRNGYGNINVPELKNWITEDKLFTNVFIPITRIHSDYIVMKNSKDITVFNTFIYGGRRYLRSENSSAYIANTGCDGNSKEYGFLNQDGGKITVVNFMRSTSDGKGGWNSFEVTGNGKLKIYNRISVDLNYNEFNQFVNVDYDEITANDFATFIMQKLIFVYIGFGKIITKIVQK